MEHIFINPLDDTCFKVIFGPKLGYNNMLNFLRALLPELGISEIEYLDTEQTGLSPEEGKSVFDLSVLTGDGSRVIIEMQKTNLRFFNYRSVYYTSHAVQLQATRERERQRAELIARHREPYWNYWFPPVYFIVVLVNGMGGPSSDSDTSHKSPYIREFRLRDKNTGEDMGVELNYLYLCLDRFDKSAKESKNPVDRFMYSLKNIAGLKEMPESFGDSEEMIELYDRSLTANLPLETIHEIEIHKNMTTKNDILVALAEAREEAAREATAKALAEGVAKGEAKGRTEGRAEGRAEGLAEGRSDTQRELAQKMLFKGMSVQDISELTGMSVEDIENLNK